MFERRLKILLAMMGIPVVGLLLRLVQLQVVDAGQYRAESARLLLKDTVYYPCLRGEITDHDGTIRLAYDAPSWDICVHYRSLAGEEQYKRQLMTTHYRGMDSEAAQEALKRDIDASWVEISEVSGQSLDELWAARDVILRRVAAEKRDVEKRAVRNNRAVPRSIISETIPHPVVRGLDQQRQALARERLRRFEWVSVVADQRRMYAGGPAFGPLLGKLGAVGPDDVNDDLYEGVPLGELYAYEGGDLKGVSGLELMGERWLRGRRGRRREDIKNRVVNDPPPAEPQNGKTLRLSIDLPLQQAAYERLKYAIAGVQDGARINPYSTGGAAVILDVPSREVLAIVSYPSFDADITGEELETLAEDELAQPLIFRPLRMRYPPGSMVKPMLLAAALTDGVVTSDTQFRCDGLLFPDFPDRWRCPNHEHRSVDPLYAIQHSCNVYFYQVGERMGCQRIAWWMSQFGLGRDSGTGFPQEASGHLPRTNEKGTARQAGIGQDQVDATPIQVANMMATLASGVYRPATLWADDPRPRAAHTPVSPDGRPITQQAWRLAREGMYRVVNVEGGTGYRYARLTDAGDYILVGKTGSATSNRREARYYTVLLPDGSTKEEVGYSLREVQHRNPGANVIRQDRIESYFPPEYVEPTHAWFGGYLTTKDRRLESNVAGRLNVAVAVVIEFAGHGGDAAAPVALDLTRAVLERQGETSEAAHSALSTQHLTREDGP